MRGFVMRVVFGQNSLRFFRFENYEEMNRFAEAANGRSLILGEDAEVYAAFHGMEISPEFGGKKAACIGMITRSEISCPQVFAISDGTRLAVGFDNCVAFVGLSPSLSVISHALNGFFHCFLWKNGILTAIHELGAVGFDTDGSYEIWSVHTDIVEDMAIESDELVLSFWKGEKRRIRLRDGYEPKPK